MIRVRHYRGTKWQDAWLVQVIAGSHSQATCVLAYHQNPDFCKHHHYEPDTMALYLETNIDLVRIKRKRIPL
jgi:hypothetical protein